MLCASKMHLGQAQFPFSERLTQDGWDRICMVRLNEARTSGYSSSLLSHPFFFKWIRQSRTPSEWFTIAQERRAVAEQGAQCESASQPAP